MHAANNESEAYIRSQMSRTNRCTYAGEATISNEGSWSAEGPVSKRTYSNRKPDIPMSTSSDIFRSQDSVGSATSAGEADDAWDEERIPAFEHQLSSIMERDGVLHLFLVDGADLNAKRMTAELCSTKR